MRLSERFYDKKDKKLIGWDDLQSLDGGRAGSTKLDIYKVKGGKKHLLVLDNPGFSRLKYTWLYDEIYYIFGDTLDECIHEASIHENMYRELSERKKNETWFERHFWQ